METQTFMPEMETITSGNVQTPSTQPQSNSVSSAVSQSSQQQQQVSQQSQASQRSQTQGSTSQNTTSSQSQQQSQGTNASTQVNVAVSQQTSAQSQQQTTIVQAPQPSQQYIAVAVSEDDSAGQETVTLQNATQAVHPSFVQYVEGNADPNIYTATNGQMTAYPVYCVSDTSTMYTPATAYYNAGSSTAVTYSQVSTGLPHATVSTVGLQGQLLAHQGVNTYLVQGNNMDGDGHALTHGASASPQTEGSVSYLVQGASVDGDSHHLTHATRVSPVTNCSEVQKGCLSSYLKNLKNMTPQIMENVHFWKEVQWLLDNYETAEGVSLPRSTLYNHYLRHCAENKLDPVNAASFGKLIRSVFLGLRTRRLGTRGNSKYHYYGIRVKPGSPLNQLAEDIGTMALRQQPMNQGKRYKPPPSHKSDSQDSGHNPTTTNSQNSSSSSDSTSPEQQKHQQFLGDASCAIPNFGEIHYTNSTWPDSVSLEDVLMFQNLYKEHCESFLDAVISLQFSMVETLWQQFWRNPNLDPSQEDIDLEKRLSKCKLFALCKCEPIQLFICQTDYQFYQNLVEVLIPDVLRPIPSSLTQAIRNFAKSLEGWLSSAMADTPEEILKIKISAVSAFAQTLRRYTSLNHLAQAARAVLQNSSQISQMLADLNRVDFHNVQEQASWVCQCDDGMVQKLEQDFKLTLQQQNSLEQWASWLEGVVTQVLKPHEGKQDFAKAARQFLLKWSFYSSMVIRDLTLRSAASFGSFHLIRLLYDEYMFYLIEHKVALATNETPIAVMGEFIGLGHKLNLKDLSNSKSSPSSSIVSAASTNGNHTSHSGNSGQLSNSHSTSAGQKIIILNSTTTAQNIGTSTPTSHIAKRLKTN